MNNNYDVGIIGAGVSGAFASLKIAEKYKNIKTIVFDIGRPPMKRRRQLEGWLGCLPNSDGKLYVNDLDKITKISPESGVLSSYSETINLFNEVSKTKIIKDKSPNSSTLKKIAKSGYSFQNNDYIQLYPKDIHSLSKNFSGRIKNSNITFSFDNEVASVDIENNIFKISTEKEDFFCKKIILCVGRSGWRWASNLYSKFGIISNNDTAKFGIRVELNSNYLKEFNNSNCTLLKNDIEIGPLNWFGTVIPEDHVDLAISAFRSNEKRWDSDKVSFSLIGNKKFPSGGYQQTDRLGRLTFILTNDRIVKEKISLLLSGKSKISIIKEYDWLADSLTELSEVMPELMSKGYFHVPTILPLVPNININSRLETDVPNMYVAGESAGVTGILSAACMGNMVADFACQ